MRKRKKIWGLLKMLKIKFIISPYRKHKPSNFNPKLSKYWNDMYYAMFRKWS